MARRLGILLAQGVFIRMILYPPFFLYLQRIFLVVLSLGWLLGMIYLLYQLTDLLLPLLVFFYADDILLFFCCNSQNIKNIMIFLYDYRRLSGQMVSLEKYFMYFGGTVSTTHYLRLSS